MQRFIDSNILFPLSQMGFAANCTYALCPRLNRWNGIPEFKEGDSLFINWEWPQVEAMLCTICDHLKANSRRIYFFIMKEPVVQWSIIEKLIPYTLGIFMQNNIYNHPLCHFMPIGIRDGEESFSEHKGFSQKYLLNEGTIQREKSIQCLLCFTLDQHSPPDRVKCNQVLQSAPFITNLNTQSWDEQPSIHCGKVPVWINYQKTHESYYTLCPAGRGTDTHRFFEAIYLDSIPIVTKTNTAFDQLYEFFPCLIINDWNEVTREFLDKELKSQTELMRLWKLSHSDWWYNLDRLIDEILQKSSPTAI